MSWCGGLIYLGSEAVSQVTTGLLIYPTIPCECGGRTECVAPTATGSLYGSLVWCRCHLAWPVYTSQADLDSGMHTHSSVVQGVSVWDYTTTVKHHHTLALLVSKHKEQHFLRSDCLMASFVLLIQLIVSKLKIWPCEDIHGSQCLSLAL